MQKGQRMVDGAAHELPGKEAAGEEGDELGGADSGLSFAIPWSRTKRATRRTFGWPWIWMGSSPSTVTHDGSGAGVRSVEGNARGGVGEGAGGQRSGEVLFLSSSQGRGEEGGRCGAMRERGARWHGGHCSHAALRLQEEGEDALADSPLDFSFLFTTRSFSLCFFKTSSFWDLFEALNLFQKFCDYSCSLPYICGSSTKIGV